jgi:hypothetical protein
VSVDDAAQLFPDRRTFLDVLMEIPEELPLAAADSPLRAKKFG